VGLYLGQIHRDEVVESSPTSHMAASWTPVRSSTDHPPPMSFPDAVKLLRIIASTLAAALCALGLSVGAALAEDHAAPVKGGQKAPQGLCFLHDL
jgi:hypothetical protein